KRSQALRENSPVKEAFINEIYIYKTILPIFTQFQRDKGIEDPFNSVPKCYGSHTTEDMEIIVFENLKKNGYVLWNKRKPLTRKHINMVVKEYGKFHAISVAMRDQQPEKFEKLAKRLHDTFKKFVEKGNMETLFGTAIQDVYDALQNDLDDIILSKWKNFRQQINFVFKELMQNVNGLTVVTHGDCWNNNFMFYSDVDNIDLPSEVAILDWQISKLSSPIFDLSYFLFACISKDDIEDLDIVLNEYYQSFSNYLRRLGSDPEVLYPLNKFLSEWKQFSKFGIFMSSLVMKICSVDVDEVPDIVETAEKGQDFSKAFLFTVRDKTNLRNRMRHIVKYAVEIMATATNKTTNEIKSYLTSIFNNENVQDFSIKILGNAEKGDGFIGDIVFAQVTAVTKTGTTREYNLVLKCISGLDDLVVKFVEMTGMQSVFEANVEEIHNLLKNHFEETILSKWITLKRQIHSIFRNVDLNELNVVTHGDCWNNNFMFYYDNKKSDLPVKVNVLDWQMARLSSPVCDLAYFIFACISEEDLNSLNAILELYYKSLGETLRELGSDPEKLYPLNDFLDHWKKYSKFGVVMASLIIKMCFSEKNEIPDMAQTAESGNDISATFSINIKDKTSFINRISYIVKYVVEHDLI
ncbi:EcKinase, DUF1679, and/or APH domain containing protein, partial [Asbolus verrucosus]